MVDQLAFREAHYLSMHFAGAPLSVNFGFSPCVECFGVPVPISAPFALVDAFKIIIIDRRK